MAPRRSFLLGKFITIGVLGAAVAIPGHAQHVHGEMDLGIVIEDDTLSVTLHAPLSDVVGFERAAENDEEAKTLRETEALLKDADRMFGLPDAAGCEIQDVNLEGPDYLLPDSHDDEHEEAHAHGDDHDSHSDEYADDHSDEDSGSHSHGDLDAQYVWQCGTTAEITELETRFIAGFAGVELVKVQIITPDGARVFEDDSRPERITVSEP